MNILLVGHTCCPGRGSEPGITWNTAWNLAEHHRVWVITHPQHQAETDEFLAANPRANLRMVYLNLPPKWDPWDMTRGERGVKLHYLMWQHVALRKARELVEVERIDIAHHISFGTINAAPLLHKLPIPVVWGPLGGGEVMPLAFRRYFKGRLPKELLRRAYSAALPFVPSIRRMSKRARMCLVSNRESARILQRAGARNIELAIDCGLPDGYAHDATPARASSKQLQLLWAGRFEHRKALPLALEALAQTAADTKLIVAGDGPLKSQWDRLAAELGVADRVEFVGSVPWSTMSRLFRESHAFVFTSLRDRFGTVVLEAMAHGLPILTLDHNGVACFVPDAGGIRVPVTVPEQTVAELAAGMERLAASPAEREQMGAAALAYARTRTWRTRAQELVRIYKRLSAGTPIEAARSFRAPREILPDRPDPSPRSG
jgi:glycosyltransferase involved in cell wall biosynthesis